MKKIYTILFTMLLAFVGTGSAWGISFEEDALYRLKLEGLYLNESLNAFTENKNEAFQCTIHINGNRCSFEATSGSFVYLSDGNTTIQLVSEENYYTVNEENEGFVITDGEKGLYYGYGSIWLDEWYSEGSYHWIFEKVEGDDGDDDGDDDQEINPDAELAEFHVAVIGKSGDDYYGTLMLGKNWILPDGYKAYVVNSSLELVEIETNKSGNTIINAKNAVIIKGNRNESLTVNTTEEKGNAVVGNLLRGVLVDTSISAEDNVKFYKLSYGTEELAGVLGFYWDGTAGDEGATINAQAHKAYLRVEGNGGASNYFALRFADAEGINAVATSKTEAIYNLQGQRVNAAKAGVYVQNGKKVIR